jgi:hypothetical protein
VASDARDEVARLNAFKVPAVEVVREYERIQQLPAIRPEIRAVCTMADLVVHPDGDWQALFALLQLRQVEVRTLGYITDADPESVVSDGVYARLYVDAIRHKASKGLLSDKDKANCLKLMVWDPRWPTGAKHWLHRFDGTPPRHDLNYSLCEAWYAYARGLIQALGDTQDPAIVTWLCQKAPDLIDHDMAMYLTSDVLWVSRCLAASKGADNAVQLAPQVAVLLEHKVAWQSGFRVEAQLGDAGNGPPPGCIYPVVWAALYIDCDVWLADGTFTAPLSPQQQRRLEDFKTLPYEEQAPAAIDAFLARHYGAKPVAATVERPRFIYWVSSPG